MKRILDQCSNRHGFDGWCIYAWAPHAQKWFPLDWSFSTTREECRQELRDLIKRLGTIDTEKYKIDKARLKVEAIA